mmetsp:Transcript_11512/g.33126  ORF Transcript_11512/g.33126 Transcript_11512/m.33126 type:complete len:752 (+) Transcript_11512:162-2417(+)|eukprot:CAMPEP_0172380994 /NCGR_PEP_ID=MMETSP1060-20121228/70721_1 /TAXON_ID=37318 /ORGANISM="Pseudo-nitzschia pungens, Strain cf. cingulata" /LENGTH=751 /DNA_ID=CAMNT_0013108761 /DNA_START=150 /DNA_END=2405 /DNA_ORIENTATION=+
MTSSVSISSSSDTTSAATPAISTTTSTNASAGVSVTPVAASSNSIASADPMQRTVVTAKRKEELLLQARAERKRWVREVPFPYDAEQLSRIIGNSGANVDGTAENGITNGSAVNQLWSSRDSLDKLQNSLICGNRFLPGATTVLSELYGINSTIGPDDEGQDDNNNDENGEAPNKELRDNPLSLDEVADRVERLAKPYLGEDQNEGQELLITSHVSDHKGDWESETTSKGTTTQNSGGKTDIDDDQSSLYEDLRTAYVEFLDAMVLPESAVTVQGMKNFVRQFATSPNSTKKYDNYDLQVRNMASVVNGHARSSYDSLATKSRSKSNTSEGLPDKDRRSLESFLYGQTKAILDFTLDRALGNSTSSPSAFSPFSMTQISFDARLEELQFLQPSHLEIACLNDDVDSNDNSYPSTSKPQLEKLLKEPIKALRSVEAFYSPYEKLCRVLDVFRGVNAALSKTSKTVPSADDVLPTVILVVVKAAATSGKNKTKVPPLRNLLRDLYFIESFALPEYLRGEAGYAFTNLYGAVQFLQELELDINGDGTSSQSSSNRLSISPKELRHGLERSRADAAKSNARRNGTLGEGHEGKSKGLISQGVDQLLHDINSEKNNFTASAISLVPAPSHLSVREVRAARLRGETLDLEWARRNNEKQVRDSTLSFFGGIDSQSSPAKSPSRSKLPQQRYTFLGIRPENVKLSDLPKLLDEYRKLVLVTDDLLGEQQRVNSKIQLERKRQREERHRRSLGERALLL